MQLISVYLYPNKIDVFTNTLAAWQPERYRRVYNRNLKIHRGVDNRIDLQVRNSDQKAQAIAGAEINASTLTSANNGTKYIITSVGTTTFTSFGAVANTVDTMFTKSGGTITGTGKVRETVNLVFNLVNRESKELILQKDCIIQNVLEGKAYVILSNTELAEIEPGFYQYSIVSETRELNGDTYTVSVRTSLYIDSQYGAFSPIEITGDVFGEPVDSVRVKDFKNYQPYDPGTSLYYISDIIDAQPQYGTPQSLHTFQINMTNYIGDVTIQGSQSAGGNPERWVDLHPPLSAMQDPVLYQNITGKFNWFRIKYVPDLSNTGKVDSVLYR